MYFIMILLSYTKSHIINIAHDHGIDIVVSTMDTDIDADVLGYYSKRNRTITILADDNNFEITLKHELIHAVQHCKGINDYVLLSSYEKIKDCIHNKKINTTFIDIHTSKKLRLIEYEAYCLENEMTYARLGEYIKKFCRHI
jgi:hypothetical protein